MQGIWDGTESQLDKWRNSSTHNELTESQLVEQIKLPNYPFLTFGIWNRDKWGGNMNHMVRKWKHTWRGGAGWVRLGSTSCDSVILSILRVVNRWVHLFDEFRWWVQIWWLHIISKMHSCLIVTCNLECLNVPSMDFSWLLKVSKHSWQKIKCFVAACSDSTPKFITS